MNSEFEKVDFTETILWDRDAEERVYSMPTGTPDHPAHRIEVRVARNPFGKLVHKNCGGTIRYTITGVPQGSGVFATREWYECLVCHKRFDETEW